MEGKVYRKARTYQFDTAVITEIERLASVLEVWPSDLVYICMVRALAEVASGRWKIGRKAVKFQPIFED